MPDPLDASSGSAFWTDPQPDGRIGLLEPDRFCREECKTGPLAGSIDVCLSPASLARWAGSSRRDPLVDRIVIGLADRLPKHGWAELDEALQVIGPGGLQVYVHARRCDISRLEALTRAGAVLGAGETGAPDGVGELWLGPSQAPPAPLLKTLGASELAREHGLRPREYRVIRTLMDIDRKELAGALGIAPKTAQAHISSIRSRTGMSTASFIRAAYEWALLASGSLGAHPSGTFGAASGVYPAALKVSLGER